MRVLLTGALIFWASLTSAAAQTSSSSHQPIDVRQICGVGDILDAPAGQVVSQLPEGTPISVTDFGFGPDGRSYYQIDLSEAGAGYVATENAPHFCGYANRRLPGAARFVAPPNTCHLIAASRSSIDEVNAFAFEYPDFVPSMSVYLSDNGGYAISLGMVSLLAVDGILDNATNIPGDTYCADGQNYVSVLDMQVDRFSEIPPQEPGTNLTGMARAAQAAGNTTGMRRACLLGDGPSCVSYADAVRSKDNMSVAERFEIQRFWMLGCMSGEAAACANSIRLGTRYRDHALVVAWPEGNDLDRDILRELLRTGCDAGVTDGCSKLAGREMSRNTYTPPEYLNALQAKTAACTLQDNYACRDMFRLLESRERAMEQPASIDDQYYSAHIWGAICNPTPGQVAENTCAAAYQAYAAFLEASTANTDRETVAIHFLQTGCEVWNASACFYYSTLAERVSVSDRNQAASRAITSCQEHDIIAPVCSNIDTVLAQDLPASQSLHHQEFDRLALTCQTEDNLDGTSACSQAMRYYVKHISDTDTAELEAMLQGACTDAHIAGCNSLAFVYSTSMMTGQDLSFEGLNQPERRLAALTTGCRLGALGLPNCDSLGELQIARGEHAAAQKSYGVACTTVMANNDATRFAQGRGACFSRGLHALRQFRDYDTARADFEFVCANEDQTNGPYACKHLALMALNGLGGEEDLTAAFDLFRQGCFASAGRRGDGEACLYYGNLLVENRDRAEYDQHWNLADVSVKPDDAQLAQLAIHINWAYTEGCLSRWTAACEANEAFITHRLNGSFPFLLAECQIRNVDGQTVSNQHCERLTFFEVAHSEDGSRERVIGNIYIWPDGDRTTTVDDRYLNGVETNGAYWQDGMECMDNPETGNSFCVKTNFEDEW